MVYYIVEMVLVNTLNNSIEYGEKESVVLSLFFSFI